MRPEERDLAYLWDMLDAARTALEFTGGATFHDYDRDRKLQLGTARGTLVRKNIASFPAACKLA